MKFKIYPRNNPRGLVHPLLLFWLKGTARAYLLYEYAYIYTYSYPYTYTYAYTVINLK